ncbi:DUF2909 domain-containing protein [Crenobacter intestini]|uniref:DUF2909 domain-containing protein n=1 Tax=Crenobacter intestini TaxID=2563443 RepID=UPI001457F2D9|nr:DUF2909 domain-containing protein [Crenobacter intestini]
MKALLAAVVVAILYALFSGLAALMRPQTDPARLARLLTVRVALSGLLFALLIGGGALGWWGR